MRENVIRCDVPGPNTTHFPWNDAESIGCVTIHDFAPRIGTHDSAGPAPFIRTIGETVGGICVAARASRSGKARRKGSKPNDDSCSKQQKTQHDEAKVGLYVHKKDRV